MPMVAEIACAVSRGNVHAAAERDGKMRVVAADALALAEYLPRRHGRARMLVTERDVVARKSQIAWTRAPARRCPLK